MKSLRMLALTLALCLCAPLALAEVEPPRGELEYYKGKFGHHCVVLCEALSVRSAPSYDAPVVSTFTSGSVFVTTGQQDGWQSVIALRDGSELHWVRLEYLVFDPAYYTTGAETPVYAYDGIDAPRVALLEAGVNLPIIKETDTHYIVSLRGASGFIRK